MIDGTAVPSVTIREFGEIRDHADSCGRIARAYQSGDLLPPTPYLAEKFEGICARSMDDYDTVLTRTLECVETVRLRRDPSLADAIEAHYVDGIPMEQVAAAMGTTVSKLRSRILYAFRWLDRERGFGDLLDPPRR